MQVLRKGLIRAKVATVGEMAKLFVIFFPIGSAHGSLSWGCATNDKSPGGVPLGDLNVIKRMAVYQVPLSRYWISAVTSPILITPSPSQSAT